MVSSVTGDVKFRGQQIVKMTNRWLTSSLMALTGTGGAWTGTGGAVCKGATLSVEQKEADGALAPVRSSLDTSFGDRTVMYERKGVVPLM